MRRFTESNASVGASEKKDCHRASQLECLHGLSIHNLLWQFVLVRDYSKAKRMLAATGFTPLLVNLESMTSKSNVSGGRKDCVAWKVEKAVH